MSQGLCCLGRLGLETVKVSLYDIIIKSERRDGTLIVCPF
jgi:hypothetical protein